MCNVTIEWIPRIAARHRKNEVMKRGLRIFDWWEEPLGDGDMTRQQNLKASAIEKVRGKIEREMQKKIGELPPFHGSPPTTSWITMSSHGVCVTIQLSLSLPDD